MIYIISECVPVYLVYEKQVEADSEEAALELARNWSKIDADEIGPIHEDEAFLPVQYRARLRP